MFGHLLTTITEAQTIEVPNNRSAPTIMPNRRPASSRLNFVSIVPRPEGGEGERSQRSRTERPNIREVTPDLAPEPLYNGRFSFQAVNIPEPLTLYRFTDDVSTLNGEDEPPTEVFDRATSDALLRSPYTGHPYTRLQYVKLLSGVPRPITLHAFHTDNVQERLSSFYVLGAGSFSFGHTRKGFGSAGRQDKCMYCVTEGIAHWVGSLYEPGDWIVADRDSLEAQATRKEQAEIYELVLDRGSLQLSAYSHRSFPNGA
jgi:hypothetical protein